MNYDYPLTDFSKALLAGLYAGISATIINLAYDLFYRSLTGFSLSQIINVATIIIASTLLLTVVGLIYYCFKHYLKKGNTLYKSLFFVITAVATYWAMRVERSPDPVSTNQFHWLLAGCVVILGAAAIFFVPYLFKRDDIYM